MNGTYGRPHLSAMHYNGWWRCRDTHGYYGHGRTATQAYNDWVDCVQFHRLANGDWPAPLKRATGK